LWCRRSKDTALKLSLTVGLAWAVKLALWTVLPWTPRRLTVAVAILGILAANAASYWRLAPARPRWEGIESFKVQGCCLVPYYLWRVFPGCVKCLEVFDAVQEKICGHKKRRAFCCYDRFLFILLARELVPVL
jgi:hypothetical protein